MGLVKRSSAPPLPSERRERDRDVGDLVAQLQDPDAEARRWAARDLADHPEAVPALVARLRAEGAHPVREAILTALLRVGGADVARELTAFLRSEEVTLRVAVIEVLQQLPHEVGALVDDLLRDEDSDVRIFAVDIVRHLPHPRVPDWLRRVLRQDPHVNVVASALDAVSEVAPFDLHDEVERVKDRFPGNSYLGFLADAAARRPSRAS